MRRSRPKFAHPFAGGLHQPREIGPAQGRQDKIGQGGHGGGARAAEEQRDLTEPGSRAQPPEHTPARGDLHLALPDDEIAVARVALANDRLAGSQPDRLETLRHAVELVRLEPPEEGQGAERLALVARRADARRDLIAVADPALEVAAVERPQVRSLRRAHGRAARPAVEERELAEPVAGAHDGEDMAV